MLAAMLFTEEGPIIIQTSHDSLDHPRLLELLAEKGIRKFIGFQIPLGLVQSRYGMHYLKEARNRHQSDELIVIDDNNRRAFYLFSFSEMSDAMVYEAPELHREAFVSAE